MSPETSLLVAPAALLIEAALGYPGRLVALIGHPVMLFGAFIARLDRGLNREEHGFARRRAQGVLAVVLLLAVCGAGSVIMTTALHRLPMGWAWEALAASALIAQRSLYDHVRAVADGLRFEGLAGGRAAVAMIVGRDVSALDEAGVSRAAIESLAENFSDGIVSPVCRESFCTRRSTRRIR